MEYIHFFFFHNSVSLIAAKICLANFGKQIDMIDSKIKRPKNRKDMEHWSEQFYAFEWYVWCEQYSLTGWQPGFAKLI